MKQSLKRGAVALLAALGLSIGTAFAPAPAAADDYTTSAIVGGVVGAIATSLLLDGSRNQYYYVNNYRRVYVSNSYARQCGYGGGNGYRNNYSNNYYGGRSYGYANRYNAPRAVYRSAWSGSSYSYGGNRGYGRGNYGGGNYGGGNYGGNYGGGGGRHWHHHGGW